MYLFHSGFLLLDDRLHKGRQIKGKMSTKILPEENSEV